MRAGNFRSELDEIQLASHDQFSERADQYGKSHILADVADVEKAVADLKFRPGTTALDVRDGQRPHRDFPGGKGIPGHRQRHFPRHAEAGGRTRGRKGSANRVSRTSRRETPLCRQHVWTGHLPGCGAPLQRAGNVHSRNNPGFENLRLSCPDRRHRPPTTTSRPTSG